MALTVGALLGTLRLDNDHYMRTLRQTEAATRAQAQKSASEVEKSAARVHAARNKELDAAGKVRVAEAQLADVRRRSNASAARLIAAEEKLATAKRAHAVAASAATRASRDHDRAMRDFARSTDHSVSRLQVLQHTLRALVAQRNTTLHVDADTGQAVAKIARLTSMRPRVTVNVDADTGAATIKILGLAAAAHAAAGSTSLLSNRLAALSALAVLVAGPAIGLLGTAILGLPGAIAMAGAAVGALVLGMDGIKRAAQIAVPALDQLKAAVSATFYQGMVPVFQLIGGVLLPGITAGMQHVAWAISGAALAVTQFVTSGLGMNLVNQIIFNTGNFIARIHPFLVQVTHGFLTLSAVGSAAMGHFAGVLNRIGVEFNAMVQRLANSGVLYQAFVQLGNVVGELSVVFFRLLEASAHLMVRLGPNMTNTLRVLGDAIMLLVPFLAEMGRLFFTLVDILVMGLTPAFQFFTPVVRVATDILQFLSPVLSSILSVLVPTVAVIGAVAAAWKVLNFVMALNPFVLVAMAIATFVGVLIWAYNNVGWFRDAVHAAWNVISTASLWLWNNVLQPFFGWLGGILVAIGNAFVWLWQHAVVPAWNAIGAAVSWVWNNVLSPIFGVIGGVVTSIGNAFLWLWQTVVVPAWNGIGSVISFTWNNILLPVFDAIGTAARVLAAIILTVLITPWVVAWNALSAVFAGVWNGVIRPVFDAIGAAARWLWDTVLRPVFTWIGDAWSNLWHGVRTVWNAVGQACWNAVAAAAHWLWNNVLSPVFGAIGAGWRALVDGINWVWLNILRPCWNAVADAAHWLWNNVLAPVFGAIGAGWRALVDGIGWAWQHILRPCWEAVAATARWLWENVCRPVFDSIGRAWRGLMDGIEWARAHIFQPAFDAIHRALDALQRGFEATVNWIGDVWNRLRGILARPVNFMIDHVYNGGVKATWDKVAGWLKLPGLPGMGRIPEHAKGGIIPGYSPGHDTQLSWVSPGEAIMRPEFTKAVGPGWIHHMNKAARTGGASGVRQAITSGDKPSRYGNEPTPKVAPAPDWLAASGSGVRHFGKLFAKYATGAEMRRFAEKGALPSNVTEAPVVPGKAGRESLKDYYLGRIGLPRNVKTFPYVRVFEDGGIPERVREAQEWAKAQHGKPYIWGGVGPAGYDCSGFMSAIHNFLVGAPVHRRRYTTHTFSHAGGNGFMPGLHSAFTIGVTHAGVGHMAGTLGGANVESGGSPSMTKYVQNAAGATHPQFPIKLHLPEVGGRFIDGGGAGFDPWFMVKQWWSEHEKGAQLRPAINAANEAPKKFDAPAQAWVKPFFLGKDMMLDQTKEDETPLHRAAADIISHIMDWIMEFFGAIFGGVFDSALATTALIMTGSPLSWLPSLLRRIQQESTGNPRAVNMWDSNASLGGTHGLMQLLHQNFARYRDPRLPNDIYNPLANIVAAINYTIDRYGSGPAGWDRPGGYDSGGWLEPGTTYAVNKTGKPEAVLTNEQWRAVESGGIQRHYHLTVYNAGNSEIDLREQFRRMEILGGL